MSIRPASAWPPVPIRPEVAGPPTPARPAPLSTPAGAPDPWVPAGSSVRIRGLVIAGGLLYVGRHLDPPGFGRDVEPALIDPSLPVYLSEADLAGSSLGYGLSYSRISPRARAGYLHWLWTGRKEAAAPIGYVYLYFFGLERRILHDRLTEPIEPADLPAIRAEVDRLRSTYGTNERFRVQAGRFAECLDVLGRLETPTPGPLPGQIGQTGQTGQTPPAGELSPVLRLELGRLAAGAGRLPADWALAWVRQAPEIRLRAPAERCPEEFDRLFLLRYRRRFGDGLALAESQGRLRLYYRPASPGFTGEVRLPVGDLPDPSMLRGPTRKLADLARSVTEELSSYSRLVGRQPEKRGSLAALALLPAELAAGGEAAVAAQLAGRAEAALRDDAQALVDAPALRAAWPEAGEGALGREQAATLARILESRGIGIEPDVRFGGPPLGDGPAVLFRCRAPALDERAGAVTRPVASALLRLTALVAGAARDAVASGEMARTLAEKAAGMFDDLVPFSRERVAAQLWWALQARPGSATLKRRLATLDDLTRMTVGAQLVSLAAGSGRIGPPQMSVLAEAFRLLGLDPGDLFSTVHELSFEPHPARDGASRAGAEPRRSVPGDTATSSAAHRVATLDRERIRLRLAETADVAAFLGEIFVDDDPPLPSASAALSSPAAPTSPDPPDRSGPPTPEVGLAGLDAAHAELVRRLADRPSWSRAEVEGLAGGLGLLPDGALDALNETAIDRAGEPLCEGEDPVEINAFALAELLG